MMKRFEMSRMMKGSTRVIYFKLFGGQYRMMARISQQYTQSLRATILTKERTMS